MQTRHRAAFEMFLNELDKRTAYDYTHFGYAVDGRKAAATVFREMRGSRIVSYVLLDGEYVVGFGHLDFFPNKEKQHVVKLGIVLHPKYQGKGFGKLLLDYMIADATRMGKEKIWLATHKDNPRALALYRNRGFAVEGLFRREEKVGRKYRDIVSMALFLRKGKRRRRNG